MARRAKLMTSRAARTERAGVRSAPERAAESLTELAAESGAQAMRMAAAVARGVARGVASAAREMRRPIGEMTAAAAKTVRIVRDSAAQEVERATRRPRRAATRRPGSARRRSA
jgi:hypothetical protein